ncbi:MAG: hypothetical protein ACKVKF_21900 [Rhodobacterales bacterium]
MLEELLNIGEVARCETGYVARRNFGRGAVIGPIVAQNASLALSMIRALARPGEFLRIDTTPETEIAPHLKAMGLEYVGGGTSMVRGARRRATAPWSVMALASQAIG